MVSAESTLDFGTVRSAFSSSSARVNASAVNGSAASARMTTYWPSGKSFWNARVCW